MCHILLPSFGSCGAGLERPTPPGYITSRYFSSLFSMNRNQNISDLSLGETTR